MNNTALQIVTNCSRVIRGKENEIKNLLVAFLCGGHVLLEDRPGTGKTMLLRSFAKTVGGDYKRIQFTPDLQPSDLTGINFYNPKTGDFEFRQGPLFANFILADEINRATPRTQSALLEAMGERQISVDGQTYPLEAPFMVLATQNPLESMGTFPLPDAQMDRFFLRMSLGYMTRSEEMELMCGASTLDLLAELEQIVDTDALSSLRKSISSVTCSKAVQNYLMDIIEATRSGRFGLNGVSVRGTLDLYHGAQALAAIEGRTYIIPEDVKYLAPYILGHRVQGNSIGSSRNTDLKLADLLAAIEVPLEAV